jgi:hypothetical protein
LFGRSPGEKTTGTFHRKVPSNGLILAAQNARLSLCDNQKIAAAKNKTVLTSCGKLIALLSSFAMPQILIRKLDESIVRKLRTKAAADGVSAEEEARRILRRSLLGDAPAVSLIDFLRTMPDADDDRIFERSRSKPRKVAL